MTTMVQHHRNGASIVFGIGSQDGCLTRVFSRYKTSSWELCRYVRWSIECWVASSTPRFAATWRRVSSPPRMALRLASEYQVEVGAPTIRKWLAELTIAEAHGKCGHRPPLQHGPHARHCRDVLHVWHRQHRS